MSNCFLRLFCIVFVIDGTKHMKIRSDTQVKSHQSQGFTLIEMVVAVGIALLITGTVVSNFTSFNSTQQVKQAAATFKNNVRYAQQYALSSTKPAGCAGAFPYLGGYKLEIYASNKYKIYPYCKDSVGASNSLTGSPVIDTSLPLGVTMSPSTTFDFAVISGAVSSSGSSAVTFSFPGATSQVITITIDSSGNVTDS